MSQLVIDVSRCLHAGKLIDALLELVQDPRAIIDHIQTRYAGRFTIEMQTDMSLHRHIRVHPAMEEIVSKSIQASAYQFSVSAEEVSIGLFQPLNTKSADIQEDSLHPHPDQIRPQHKTEVAERSEHEEAGMERELKLCLNEQNWVYVDLAVDCMKALRPTEVLVNPVIVKNGQKTRLDQQSIRLGELKEQEALCLLILNSIQTGYADLGELENGQSIQSGSADKYIELRWKP